MEPIINNYSIRLKCQGKSKPNFHYNYRTTFEIINAISDNKLANQLMISVHPQRWTHNYFDWTKELIFQNQKNMINEMESTNIIILNGRTDHWSAPLEIIYPLVYDYINKNYRDYKKILFII